MARELDALLPPSTAASPYRLEIDWHPTTAIMKSIAESQRADVVCAGGRQRRGPAPVLTAPNAAVDRIKAAIAG